MRLMIVRFRCANFALPFVAGLIVCGLAVSHSRATNRYFDVNGTTAGSGVTTGSTYSWENAVWNNNDATGTTATAAWTEGDFPRFSAGTDASGSTYTVNASTSHTFAGMFAQAGVAGPPVLVNTVHITTSGGAVLSITPGLQGFFAGANSNLYIDTPLSGVDGTSQLRWAGGGGSLFLYADNSNLTGGVQLDAANGLNFNNSASFGPATTPITFGTSTATSVIANPDTTAPLTIPNSLTMRSDANTTIIYTGHDAVTFSGTWTLGTNLAIRTNTLLVGNNPFPTAKLIISNGIVGDTNSDLVVGSPVNGTLVLPGASTYTGITTLGQITGTATTHAAPSAGNPALQADDGVGLPTTSILQLNGGVLQTSGTFSRPLSSTFGEHNVYWGFPATQTAPGGGGFSAIGSQLTVNINGNASGLGWGDAATDVGSKILGPLKFGSVNSNAKTLFVNPIDLNPLGAASPARTVTVTAGAGGDSTELSGIISSSADPGGSPATLTKNGTGTLILSTANTYTGATTISGGKLLANNTSGSATGTGAVTIATAGTLGGTGKVSGAVTNNGVIAPGSAGVGTLSFGGGVTDGANSSWAIDLSGATADKLAVTGNIDLSAVDALNVSGTGTGTSWLIGTYTGTLTGMFDTVTSGYTVSYTGGNITLNAAAAGLPGDYNQNGVVDSADYVLWRNNVGQPAGTLPNDTTGLPIGPDQYSLWRANFGNHAGAGSGLGGASAVPEPATISMLLLSVVTVAVRRRR